jgi:hypothetical protein
VRNIGKPFDSAVSDDIPPAVNPWNYSASGPDGVSRGVKGSWYKMT